MSSKNIVLQLVVGMLSGCGYGSYSKTDEGTVENKSNYALEVKVTEGCYDGKTHTFNVTPGETKPFDFSYMCDGQDDESANIRVAYVSYEKRGYIFYSFDPTPYTKTEFSEGKVIKYSEDRTLKEHALAAEELKALPGEGLRSNRMVHTYANMIRIRPSTETVEQLFYGIAKADISPFVPLIPGSFEEQAVVYQPMVKDYYQHDPDYYGQKLTLVCDDFNCFAK
jgi:hypothetical protein